MPASRRLAGHGEVVREVVAAAARVMQVAGVADRGLAETPGLQHRIDRDAHVLDRVQGVEDAEEIDARLRRAGHETLDHVIRVVGVADPVGGTQQHLQQNVGHLRAQALQALPRALAQEAQRHVEGGAAPAFEREELRQVVGVGVGDLAEIVGAHPGREQRLVGVPHGGVGDEHGLLRPSIHAATASGPSASSSAFAPAAGSFACKRRRVGIAGVGRRRGPVLHFRVAVDGGLGNVAKQAARPVARAGKGEKLRVVVDEAGRHLALPERLVAHEPFEEIDVGRDPPDPELLERAAHAVDRALARRRPRGDLLQQRIVMAGDDRARVRGATIQANAEAGGGAVGGDPPVIGDEAVERVLGRDPALHSVAPQRDVVLRRAGIIRRIPDGPALGDPDLGPHQVDAGHLLGDRVLHLNARIHLDEMKVAGVEIVQELHRARVEVVGFLRDGEGVPGERLALLRAEDGGGGAFHDLLVASLHRTIALEEVDNPAVAIRQHLDLKVAGAADETLEVDIVLARRQRPPPAVRREGRPRTRPRSRRSACRDRRRPSLP